MTDTRRTSSSLSGLLIWLPLLGLCTVVLWLFRDETHEAHMALAYLLVVLGGSARNGRRVGTVLAVLAFLTFNFFLLPPFYTLTIEDPLDWWILIAFLITGAVAAQLFHRAQSALETAERRAREIDRLSTIGAQSLAGPRAGDAVEAIARVIRSELAVPGVQIATVDATSAQPAVLAQDPDEGRGPRHPDLMRLASREGCIVGIGADGTSQLVPEGKDLTWILADGRPHVGVMIPLRVHDRTVGVLHIHDRAGLRLDEQQAAFGDTLVYYAALAVERVRLAAEAERVVALREADRLKDALLASVSHDLRTPLTTIRALGAEIRETGDERAAVIEEEAERLNRFVGDLLDLSRIRSGGMPLQAEIVAAEDLVGAALQRLRGVAGVDRVRVDLPPGDALAVGRFDFVQTLRAVANLLENALRHSGGEPVDLQVCEQEGFLVLRVVDRGAGVAEEDRERIFEPFVRGGYRRGEDHAGTGLGLAIARSVAEAHGGSLTYAPRPGGGSIFELRLPEGRLQEIS